MLQSNNDPKIIALSAQLYSWLLCIGPKEFLQEYGEVMLQDFRHCCCSAYEQQGLCGVVWLWPSMFTSAIADMGVEHFSEAARRGKQHSVEPKSPSEVQKSRVRSYLAFKTSSKSVSNTVSFVSHRENPIRSWLILVLLSISGTFNIAVIIYMVMHL